MKILVVGGTGTIGRAVVARLSGRHEVVPVGRTRGRYNVDIVSHDSIDRLFTSVGSFDALVCAAGEARFGPLEKLSDEEFEVSLANKLMGQVNLVRLGIPRIRDGGSFTLTSGVLSQEPMPGGAAISVVNAGVEAFARAAALELPRGIRINAVSPPWIAETLESMGRDPSGGMPAAKVANAYAESVEGRRTGEVLDARRFGELGS
jgi:NAD(P)-dependent dehydrogenase (short-subunit alcohol dehydrogenase family)